MHDRLRPSIQPKDAFSTKEGLLGHSLPRPLETYPTAIQTLVERIDQIAPALPAEEKRAVLTFQLHSANDHRTTIEEIGRTLGLPSDAVIGDIKRLLENETMQQAWEALQPEAPTHARALKTLLRERVRHASDKSISIRRQASELFARTLPQARLGQEEALFTIALITHSIAKKLFAPFPEDEAQRMRENLVEKVLDKFPTFDTSKGKANTPYEKFKAWIFGMAPNVGIDALRDMEKSRYFPPKPTVDITPFLQSELREFVSDMESQYLALALEGKSNEEIARALNKRESAPKVAFHRIREKVEKGVLFPIGFRPIRGSAKEGMLGKARAHRLETVKLLGVYYSTPRAMERVSQNRAYVDLSFRKAFLGLVEAIEDRRKNPKPRS